MRQRKSSKMNPRVTTYALTLILIGLALGIGLDGEIGMGTAIAGYVLAAVGLCVRPE